MSTPETFDLHKTVCVNPATGDIVGFSQMNSAEEAREAIRRARAAQPAWAALPLAERVRFVLRIRDYLVEHADAVSETISKDVGKTRVEALATEVLPSAMAVDYYARNTRRFLKPRKVRSGSLLFLNKRSRIFRIPFGVIGIIAPWNFPVQLTMGPIAGAFAAGNRVMVKSSEYTPTVAALFEEVGPKYFDATEALFLSGGPDVGKAFAELPFDHLLFTGATGIGRHILHAAADNLTPVTLELGGKSPTIIGRSADVDAATQRIALGKMMNAGQICLAPDYLMVPREKEGMVVEGMKKAVSVMYPTLLDNPDYTSVLNSRHRDRLNGYLDDARAKGADVVEVNPANEDFASSNGNKMPLYLVRNPTDDMKVMQEEIFGPVLPIKTYERVEEAIDYVNKHDRPLGLYYFGSEDGEKRKVLDRTVSGGATVNDVIFHVSMEELPFGGVGPSGMGAYHGQEGFKTFSHAKSVYHQPKVNVAKLAGFMPPYGKAARTAIARDLKV